MLPSKFGVNWPFDSEEAKNRFSRWQPWQPSWISDRNDFSYFWSTDHPHASYQVSSKLAQGCRRSRLLKQLLMRHDGRPTTHDGHWLTTTAHHEHFVLRWAKKEECRGYSVQEKPSSQQGVHLLCFGLIQQTTNWWHFSYFLGKIRKYFKMSSAETFTQHAV